LIDLHLHTTASDGRCEPAELVRRALEAGIRVLSVTDHDTVAALAQVAERAGASGLEAVPGIEITAVSGERDVHVLGYFFDPASVPLAEFLREQRADRVRRVREMAERLARLGKPIDVTHLTQPSDTMSGKSVGRPMVAAALVRAGHVTDIRQAFAELIGEGRPAYVARRGRGPAEVVAMLHDAGGIASLAHPGLLGPLADVLIPDLARRGLPALEAYHTDHDAHTTERYLSMADALGLVVTGGSDYHGDVGHRAKGFGRISLPEPRYRELKARAGRS